MIQISFPFFINRQVSIRVGLNAAHRAPYFYWDPTGR